MNTTIEKPYLPAAGRDWALPLYDLLTKLSGINRARKSLLEDANLDLASRLLDVGFGTGTLTLATRQIYPQLEAFGIDPDPKVLMRATRKMNRASVDVTFARGYSEELPYRDNSFDRVLSSFMFHHVPDEAKPQMLREAFRVLRAGGSFHMLDVARIGHEVRNWTGKHHGMNRHMRQNSDSRILEMLQSAGFSDARVSHSDKMLLGFV